MLANGAIEVCWHELVQLSMWTTNILCGSGTDMSHACCVSEQHTSRPPGLHAGGMHVCLHRSEAYVHRKAQQYCAEQWGAIHCGVHIFCKTFPNDS